jgi:hypothetical protein
MHQNVERLMPSDGLPAVLQDDRSTNFHQTIAVGEFYYFLDYLPDLIEGQSRDEVRQKVSQQIDMEKCRIAIFDPLMRSLTSVTLSKGEKIIQYSCAILSCAGWLTKSVQILASNHGKIGTSGWTMQVHTIQGDPPNIFVRLKSSRCYTRLITQTKHHPTSASSVI